MSMAIPMNAAAVSGKPSVKEILELVSKALIGFAGLCYVLGLIVVTIHLRRYGLNSLTLSQLHYVTAGVWVLLPIVAMILIIIFAKFVIDAQEERWTGKSNRQKAWDISFAIGALIIVSYIAVKFLVAPFGIQLSLVNWVAIPALGALASACVVMAITVIVNNLNRRFTGLAVAVFGLVLFMVYVVLFSGRTYQEIPWATGGGRPSQVAFVVAADAKPYLESVGVKFSSGQSRSDSLKLLLATEKEYVILDSDGRAISIPADSIKTVMYER